MQYGSLNVETNRLELKEKLTDNLEREAVAFLNSSGGRIYIGIRDDGTAVGVNYPDEMQLQIKKSLTIK
ncbi:MAG: ATP-binding protein [Tannerella sp.]|jgi:predicted HTH transcriptional regulator|nr:ATP-binding protein [Tannerella sp.]